MVRAITILFLSVLVCGATINAPTNFRTDPSDFYNDAAQRAVLYQFRWSDNADNETGYQIEISTNGVDFFYFDSRAMNATAYDQGAVPWSSNRWFRLKAVNATESSTYAGPIKCTGDMPPLGLGGSTVTTNQMTLTWQTSGGLIDGYTVQQDTSDTFDSVNLLQYYVPGQASVTYTITTNFALNTVYYFRVVSTNSVAGTGNSEAMNKPISYIECAPNGPPVAPTFQSITTIGDAGTIEYAVKNTAINATGYYIQHSTDSNTWTQVPLNLDGAKYDLTGIGAGTTNYFLAQMTNTLGYSPAAAGQLRMPNSASHQTNWYISPLAVAGNNSGVSWANAWLGFNSILWSALQAGDIVYIDGGTNGATYSGSLVTYTNGTSIAPVTFQVSREDGHNGLVTLNGGIGTKSDWQTFDGRKSVSFINTPLTAITNNIGWRIVQTGLANAAGGLDSGVGTANAVGIRFLGLEITGVGNTLAGDSPVAVFLEPAVATNGCNIEMAYCWVHDNWSSAFQCGNQLGFGPDSVRIHDCLAERWHNNLMVIDGGGVTISNCVLRDTAYPAIAHPDGFQGGIDDVHIIRNIIGNVSGVTGSTLYPELTQGLYGGLWVIDNVFYETFQYSSGVTFMFANDWVASATLSNIVYAGNTFYGTNNVAVNLGGSSSYPLIIKASRVENNIFYTGPGGMIGAAQFTSLEPASQGDLLFDHNIVCGPSKLIGLWPGGTFTYYNTAEAANAGGFYTGNSSSIPAFVNASNYVPDLHFFATDTVAKDNGTNLSALSIPGIALDADGSVRGSGAGWDIGAYEWDSSLVLYYDFETYTNGRGAFALDMSGHGNHALTVTNRTQTDVGMTNYAPSTAPGKVGNTAAEFIELGTVEEWAVYNTVDIEGPGAHTIGTYFGVTNWDGINFLTNGTWSCWWFITNQNLGAATLWSAGWLDGTGTEGSWDVSAYNYDNMVFTLFTGGARRALISFPTPAVSTWQHIAAAWDATNDIIIGYVDGLPIFTNTLGVPFLQLSDKAHNVIIGSSTHGGTWIIGTGDRPVTPDDQFPNNGIFVGRIDELKIHNRTLSAGDVYGLAHGGGTASGPAPSGPGTNTQYTLTVTKSGGGTGTVTGAGINCGSTCSAAYDTGTVVTLTATADSGSTFSGWSGDATGTGTAVVTMSQARAVTATFSANAPPVTSSGVYSFGDKVITKVSK
jgi:hypothetical protein